LAIYPLKQSKDQYWDWPSRQFSNGYLLKTAETDIATKLLLDDVLGARVPASRMRRILERIDAGKALTPIQEDFLRQNGHQSLLQFIHGEIQPDEFHKRAEQERERRRSERKAEAKLEAAENARRAENTRQKNASIFAKQKRMMERRKKIRELPDRFGLPFVEQSDLSRINRILRSVASGHPIGIDDLAWLAAGEGTYWTDGLRIAHHRNMACKLRKEWKRTADLWLAVNSCGHWRKAECPTEGLEIVKAALDQADKPRIRSALLTTGGGALRDLKHFTEAVSYGNEAHSLTPSDFRPCTLLGAVHIEMGTLAEGAVWYEKAEARGASQNEIDREIQSILRAAPEEQRSYIKNALKAYDATRYGRL